MIAKNMIWLAGESLAVRPLPLKAGPLTMSFDPQRAFLRGVRLGETEVIRGIYGAVRDPNWGTVPPKVNHLRQETAADSFRLAFEVDCQENEIHFHWQGLIVGAAEGSVKFYFQGEALSGFSHSRTGLCVLHPLALCAGRPCRVETVDGRFENGVFPRLIAPQQPFKNLRAIRYEIHPGLEVDVRFEGETFELEDQRNWTDASFKTYGTPLELPWPVRMEKGARVIQTVTVKLLGPMPAAVASPAPVVPEVAVPAEPKVTRPPLGVSLASHGQALSPVERERLRLLGLSFIRADLELANPAWRQALQHAADEARHLKTSLHLALWLTTNAPAELAALAEALERVRPKVSLWLVYHYDEPVTRAASVRMAREKLERFDPQIPFAAGAQGHFAELNQHHSELDAAALPCYSLTPQVHVGDWVSLVENLQAQADTVATTWQFAPRPVVISPITLRPRSHLPATEALPELALGQLPPSVDARQMSLFGAGWTLGSIARLSATGQVHSLTYYETTGWRGVMETEAGAVLSPKFPSLAGGVYPVFHVLADLAGFGGIAPLALPDDWRLEGLVVFDEHKRSRVLLANMSDQARLIRLKTAAREARVRYLDDTNAVQAMQYPTDYRLVSGHKVLPADGIIELKMLPFALVCVNLVS